MTTHPEPGIFVSVGSQSSLVNRPCLFLDRDGVVVEETNYLHRVEDVRLIPGVAEAVARVNAAGVAVAMITNQAGIGRGYYSWAEFEAVQKHILARYADFGAHFDIVLACAYHEAGQGAYAVANHHWRKPNPGMLLEAAQRLKIDLGRSFVVGDTLSDLFAGEAAGLKGGALVLTGHGRREWDAHGPNQFARWEDRQFAVSLQLDAAAAIGAVWPAS